MGAWAELREGIRKVILMQDRLERLSREPRKSLDSWLTTTDVWFGSKR